MERSSHWPIASDVLSIILFHNFFRRSTQQPSIFIILKLVGFFIHLINLFQMFSLVLKYNAKIVVPSVDLMSCNFPFLPPKKLLIDRVYQLNSNPYGRTLYSRALVLSALTYKIALFLRICSSFKVSHSFCISVNSIYEKWSPKIKKLQWFSFCENTSVKPDCNQKLLLSYCYIKKR